MKILFSPIGNTDPWRNDHDGAMLHIVRHYQPDMVFLYFTESIWKGNDRITPQEAFDWQKIIASVAPQATVATAVEGIEKEHDFDSYKDTFHKHLTELGTQYPDAEILLNVTSGTPQMEATLCLEYISFPENKICIQVATPLAASNARSKYADPGLAEVDLELVNQQEAAAPNRCREINIISFRETMVRNQLRSLIDNYDYEAALFLLRSNKMFRGMNRARKPLETITNRIKTHEVFPEIMEKYTDKQLQKALFHYLLVDMRFKRGDVAETLIRVKSIAEFIVEQYLVREYSGMIRYYDHKPYLSFDYNQSFIDNYRQYLADGDKELREKSILGFPAYRDIMIVLGTEPVILKQMNIINQINAVRNKVAHNLENLDLFKNNNEKNLRKSVQAVRKLLEYVYPEVQPDDYAFFTNFNKELKKYI